jgi:hypothetical protein
MKVQVQGQSIRIRLGEAELDLLLAGETLSDATLTPMGDWQRLLALGPAVALERPSPGCWALVLPEQAFRAFAGERPRRDGFELVLPAAGGTSLQLSVEVDVRESRRRQAGAPRTG